MASWMYEGLQERDAVEDLPKVLQWVGTAEDKAYFKSSCNVRDATGNLVTPKKQLPDVDEPEKFPIWTWANLPEDCTLEWEAQTIPCEDEPGSDRVEIEISTLDYVLLAQMSNDILSTWETDAVEGLLAEFESGRQGGKYENRLMDELSALIDTNAEMGALMLPTIYSDVVQTDGDGLASGEIPLPDFWPKSQYFLNIHYGYSARAESSESDKFWQFMKEWGITILTLIVVIIVIIVFLASVVVTGGGSAIWLASSIPAWATTAVFVADLGLMAHDFFATGFGIIDENVEGCLFPLTGFNHTYAFGFNMEEVVYDAAANIDPTLPPETVATVEDWLIEGDFWSKVVVLGVLGGMSLAGLRALL